MAIVCGIDFSESSARAATVAAHLAVKTRRTLHLVHTLDLVIDDELVDSRQALHDWAEERLRREVERLGAIAPSIETHLRTGLPDDALLEVAARTQAKLVVIGPAGRRLGRTTLGAHADRVAQSSHVPVLVIRDPSPFERWARESKPLKVVLGADATLSSDAALRWVDELRSFGPCDVVAVHLYWPPEQFHRLGLGGVRSYLDPDPEVTRTLEQEFFERVSARPLATAIRYRSEPHLGRVADRLADLAAEERADLVVVGTRARGALERLWEGSVSRKLLRRAQGSVACIPVPGPSEAFATPKLTDILVATDFSRVGDAAVPLAFALAPPGTTLHLVHVVKTSSDPASPHDIFTPSVAARSEAVQKARERLLQLVPQFHAPQTKAIEVHVLESPDPAAAIAQAAERLGADLVCLGTHGRSGVAKALLGSVAQGVVAHCKRPVLLARAPEE